MRRSEAILVFLFIATAVVLLATRGGSAVAGAGPRTSRAEAAALPLSSPTALPSPTATDVPRPTATPVPPYFSMQWLDQHPPTAAPPLTAKGAIVVDMDTQQIMLAKNINDRRPPASVMKIVTAMVALDSGKLDQALTVSPQAAAIEPNHMGLTAGEQVPLKDLLYGMLLDSGNDAAETLAEDLAGGRDAFIQKMNEKPVSFGLTNTHFVDAAGLDDNNYTTPYDLAVLADAALTGYPTFRQVVSTQKIVIPSTATHKWFSPINLNDLLWDEPGTYGVKVGYTDAAEYTIILAGQKDGHNILIVLLGSQHHFTEGRALFDWAYAHVPTPDGAPVRKFASNVEKAS